MRIIICGGGFMKIILNKGELTIRKNLTIKPSVNKMCEELSEKYNLSVSKIVSKLIIALYNEEIEVETKTEK
jgi:hypothetical protein